MSSEPAVDDWAALTFAAILSLALEVCVPAASADLTLDSAVGSPGRSAKFAVRDKAKAEIVKAVEKAVESRQYAPTSWWS